MNCIKKLNISSIIILILLCSVGLVSAKGNLYAFCEQEKRLDGPFIRFEKDRKDDVSAFFIFSEYIENITASFYVIDTDLYIASLSFPNPIEISVSKTGERAPPYLV